MAEIKFTLTSTVLTRVVAAFCEAYDYQDTIDGSPNPETTTVFTRRKIIEHIKGVVGEQEARVAREVAEATAKESVSSEVNIT